MQASGRIRLLHCITSLDADGAQHMLLKLCQHMKQDEFEHIVLNLRSSSEFAKRFAAIGVPVINIGMRSSLPTVAASRAIREAIKTFSPDIIQGWMYHGNIAATLGHLFAKSSTPLLWNIRKAVENPKEYRPLTRMTLKLGAFLSSRPKKVIYCGNYVAEQHIKLGYSPNNTAVIYNGFDTDLFAPAPTHYQALRSRLGLPSDIKLVGMTARFHPHKDHLNFLKCAEIVAKAHPKTHFLLAGRGLSSDNQALQKMLSQVDLKNNLHLLGERSDVPQILPALDVYCQSSSAEGFPNALGEAMACGVPCVSTNAGASAEAIGDCGKIVEINDHEALAQAVIEMLSLPNEQRTLLSNRMHQRVLKNFSLAVIATQYEDCYLDVLGRSRTECESVYG